MIITFTMFVEVSDQQALHDAAYQRAVDDGLDPEQALETIGTRDEPDCAGCVQMLADPGQSYPGTDIFDSSAEEVTKS
jgi:hypothetical protein